MTRDISQPGGLDALIADAMTLARSGAAGRAEALLLKAKADAGDRLPAGARATIWKAVGAVRREGGDAAGAVTAFETVVETVPSDAGAWASYGLLLSAADRTPDAVEALRNAVRLDPSHMPAGRNLGLALMKMQRFDEAAACYRALTLLAPEDAALWRWLGHAEAAGDKPEQAREAYLRALDLTPAERQDASGADNLGLTLALVERDLGLLDSSIKRLRAVLAAHPDDGVVEFALAQNLLLTGVYGEGFRRYESRWRRPGMAPLSVSAPLWSGEPLQGRRILLQDEQGLGDTIQFCRFAADLAQTPGARVSLLVRPRLRRLLAGLHPALEMLDEDAARVARPDFHAPLMSLPQAMGLDHPSSLKAPNRYLSAEDGRVRVWSPRLDAAAAGRLKVGLIWQGDPTSQSERGRSPPAAALGPLLTLRDAQFFLLQKDVGRTDLSVFEDAAHVADLGHEIDGGPDAFIDTAAIMSQLDAIVTSDTGPAHLAGALGVPTGVLLKRIPEWRWGLEGERTPWYPSMTLFRQKNRGVWRDPVAEARTWLQEEAAHRTSGG